MNMNLHQLYKRKLMFVVGVHKMVMVMLMNNDSMEGLDDINVECDLRELFW